MAEYRIEKDTLGEIEVSNQRYWGAQTQRSLQNFDIGGQKMPPAIIKAFAQLKKASKSHAAQADVVQSFLDDYMKNMKD